MPSASLHRPKVPAPHGQARCMKVGMHLSWCDPTHSLGHLVTHGSRAGRFGAHLLVGGFPVGVGPQLLGGAADLRICVLEPLWKADGTGGVSDRHRKCIADPIRRVRREAEAEGHVELFGSLHIIQGGGGDIGRESPSNI
eukprot:scaffold21005_cov30-Tisochrysis_lutea.AAC.2